MIIIITVKRYKLLTLGQFKLLTIYLILYSTIKGDIMSETSTTPTIKKTMVAALAFITANGNLSKDNLETFTNDFCVAKSGSNSSNGPREITILKDIDGNMLGRQCSVTKLWFDSSYFSKGTTCVKEADTAKGKLWAESKKMEKDAQSLLDEAKDITDIEDKVAKYEAYDVKLTEAKAHRASAVTITDTMTANGVESIELLAESMEVEINPVKPSEDTEEA